MDKYEKYIIGFFMLGLAAWMAKDLYDKQNALASQAFAHLVYCGTPLNTSLSGAVISG